MVTKPAMTHFRSLCPDAIERRYDGPPLPSDPALTGRPKAAARDVLFRRLAAEQRQAIAWRRAGMPAATVGGDERLHAAARALHYYRTEGVAWHERI